MTISIKKEETPEGTKFTMTEEKKIDPKKYIEFVEETTSDPSTYFDKLMLRLSELEVQDANVPKLTTAALGITAEAGEFAEIVKKIFLQGKPYNEENILHMKKELGDIMWYMAQACIALDTDFNELMKINVDKLSARYPEGSFSVYYSENRKVGDL